MQWPSEWMFATFAAAGLSLVVPWLFSRRRRVASLACIMVTGAVWYAYETLLEQRAKPGDPLIRIDLLILLPLSGCALVSCVLAMIVGTLPERLVSRLLERLQQRTRRPNPGGPGLRE